MDEGFFYCPYIPECFKREALGFKDSAEQQISLEEMEACVWGTGDEMLQQIVELEQEWATQILQEPLKWDSTELEAAVQNAVKNAAEAIGLQKFARSFLPEKRKVLSSR